MRPYIAFFLALILGTAAGLAATWLAVTQPHGLGKQQIGVWEAWPQAGTPDAEPYGRAIQARNGYLPLGAGEGVALFAERDEAGSALNGACRYHVSGRLPNARYWTLEAFTPEGGTIRNELGRSGFTSAEVVRDEEGRVDIVLARNAEPGNWLQLGSPAPFVLVLRLYDTVLSANAFALDAQVLPRITREGCP